MINQRPENGSCTSNPENGTTSTIFTINCSNWFDSDNVTDYSFYRRISSTEKLMLAFSMGEILQIRLPAGDDRTSMLNITVEIRDVLKCVKEYDMEPVFVTSDSTSINTLIDVLKNPANISGNNPLLQALASGNQNTVGQAVTSLSQEFNKINRQNLATAVASMNHIFILSKIIFKQSF
jgi:hypothetical protein